MASDARTDPLDRYRAKRDFSLTPEPKAVRAKKAAALSFVVQKHWASRLHYDFRLEWNGVLLSWAVPKGPCCDPKQKRMAVHVEDHPVSYGSFEGTIPPKQYGAGTVIVWDRGTWEPVGDPDEGMKNGKLVFRLHGEKLAGLWELVRIAKPGDKQDPWMLFKKRDEWARPLAEYDVLAALPDSVVARPLGSIEAREPKAAAVPPAGRGTGVAKATTADERGGAQDKAGPSTAAELPGAAAAGLPAMLSPQLATLAKALPDQGRWSFELKFDGYRILARIDGGRARLFTRQGNDWTEKMQSLARAVERLGLASAWLDGEIVVLGSDGTPDFNALQNAFDAARTDGIEYFLFDLPYLDGFDLRRVPLASRRALLRQRIEARPVERLHYSADFEADAGQLLQSACTMGVEGIIAKRVDAPYVSSRSPTWLKLKCSARQEFVITGFTDRANSPGEVGSLLLGYHDDAGVLRYAGNVGTGWDAATSAELRRRLAAIEVPQMLFEPGSVKPGRWSRRSPGAEHWVRPELVTEVDFAEWTPDGSIRHASFKGLREDKPARAVRRETAAAADGLAKGAGPTANPPAAKARRAAAKADVKAVGRTAAAAKKAGASPAAQRSAAPHAATASKPPATRARAKPAAPGKVRISNPDRVIDASTGLKKIDLVRYYESVAERILPHLAGRPVSLVRGPSGVGGTLFFQKHDDKLSIPGMRELDPTLWPGHAALLEVPNADALVNAAQMNVIEFHTWNSTARKIDQPDRMIFDLDPGEGVGWPQIQEAALLMHTLLAEIGLESWLKTSGGKGLHVVVPIAPKLDYDTVKDFSQAVVQHLAATIPSRFVAKSGPANRVGKIFVDYLRNGHGATTAAAFSARARPGLGVSMPVAWEQLAALKGGAQWTIANARDYLSFERADPWAAMAGCRQTLTRAMKAIGHVPATQALRRKRAVR